MSYGFTDDESMMDGVLGFLNSALGHIHTLCRRSLTYRVEFLCHAGMEGGS